MCTTGIIVSNLSPTRTRSPTRWRTQWEGAVSESGEPAVLLVVAHGTALASAERMHAQASKLTTPTCSRGSENVSWFYWGDTTARTTASTATTVLAMPPTMAASTQDSTGCATYNGEARAFQLPLPRCSHLPPSHPRSKPPDRAAGTICTERAALCS
eukprot:844247-Rhodomonas_salina.1